VTDSSAKPVRRRWWKYWLLAFALAAVAIVGVSIYVNTNSFQSLVRRRLVAEVERITGGRVEIASIHTIPFRLQVEVRNITVRGRESATDVPLAHADGIVARLKISSLLRPELAFRQLILEQPIVHVVFYPDGTTNFPSRQIAPASIQTPIEKLFALSISQLELRHGQILWDDQKIPLDFSARDTSLRMDYSFLGRRYDGQLLLGLVSTKLMDCRPFAWMTAMQFTLGENSAVITSLRWNSGHSHVFATGQVTDFRRPRLQGPYDAQFDLTEAASIARRPDLRAGLLELKGRGDWTLDQFSSTGLLTIQDLAFQDDQISFSKASLSTGYSITDQQLQLSKLQGKIFGGSFAGDAEVNQWLSPAQHLSAAARKTFETAVISAVPSVNKSREKMVKPMVKPKPQTLQNGFVLIHLRDLSAEDLAVALNTPAHSFPRFSPAASTSGTLEARWKGTPRDAEIQYALDLVPPASSARGQLPVTSHADGVYYAGKEALDLARFTLATPTSHVQASGTLSADSAVRLSVSTTSLADWLPFISAVRGPALFPVALNGTATFNGNMSGSFSSPQVSGTVAVNDFDITLPATGRTQKLQMHWDSLSTSLQLSFQSVAFRNAILRREETSAEFDGSATLQHGHFTGDSTFSLRANLYKGDLADLQALAGYDFRVFGKADLLVQANGTFSDPKGSGQIHLTNATAYGETVRQFDSNFHIGEGAIAFDDMHLFHEDSVITGSADYNPSSRAYHFDLAGSNFNLSELPSIHPGRLSVEGRADFALKGAGTPDAPSINGDVQLRNLTFDHELAGELDLHAATQGGVLHLTGNSYFQQGSLLVSGDIQLRDDYPTNLSLQMDQIDLDALWRSYLRGRLTGHSSVAGSLNLHGPLRQPGRWTADGNLSSVAIEVENVKVHNQDPVRFSLVNQSIDIQQLHLVGDGTDLTAHGSIQLSGARGLDLVADGHLDLRLLSTFDPDFSAVGLVTMNLTVGGTVADPLPQGRLHLTNGSIAYAGLPSGLTELDGSLRFTRDQVHIETLTSRTGGGTLDLKGDATYVNQQLNFNLSVTGNDVRLRYPPGVSSTADAELHWVGSRSASTVSGNISVNKIAVTPGFDFSAYLERSRQFSTVTTANSPLNNVKLDIHVQTAPELQMRTAIARLSGDADLHIRGSIARPAVLGRADILEGQATFHGTRYTLERGDITFANPVAIEPQLNLQASTHVRNYDLNITITGTPDRGLSINYRSEPPLPKSDIIALLALGRTNEESAQLQEQSGQSAFSDQATALILSQALNTTVSNRLQRLFGASNIKIDPQGLNTENNPISNGPQITIEQEFVNHVSLTYSTNVSQSSEQIIQGEYYVNRNISAVGTRDQNGVVSFDLRVRSRKK
jgi:translocation and assembly module TamB